MFENWNQKVPTKSIDEIQNNTMSTFASKK